MKNKAGFIISILLILGLILIFSNKKDDPSLSNRKGSQSHSITNFNQQDKPYLSNVITYKNLSCYLIYDQADIKSKRYLTLSEALSSKKIILNETQIVNELELSNLSNQYIYINSGEIVKGGNQDRTITYDIIIPPQMHNLTINCMCVEHDRWAQRGNENNQRFEYSTKSVAGNKLKKSLKSENAQSEVWSSVKEYQEQANMNIKHDYIDMSYVDLKETQSPSSYQLTLDNKELRPIIEAYKQAISPKFKLEKACGLAVVINGNLTSIDWYNNEILFKDLFDKLLESAITEAIFEGNKMGLSIDYRTRISTMLFEESQGSNSKKVNKITRCTNEICSQDISRYSTFDLSINKWLHKNWIID